MKQVTDVAREKRLPSLLRAIGVAATGALLMGTALTAKADITAFSPAAYAESELLVSNFRFLDATTGAPLSGLIGTVITSVEASLASTLSASVNGVPGVAFPQPSGTIINPLDPANPTVDHQVRSGPNAAQYTPFDSFGIGTMDAGVYAGAASQHSGNGLQLNGAPTTTANTHAQVNINGANAFGSADSRQTLGATFVISVGALLTADVLFDAEAYLRIALGQPDVLANATRSWTLTVRPTGAILNLVDWSPDGVVGNIGGTCVGLGACVETADAFDLNLEANTQNTEDLDDGNPSGSFGARVTLTPGTYIVTVSHETNADAEAFRVPEPGSLALLGGALLGFAGIRRRFMRV